MHGSVRCHVVVISGGSAGLGSFYIEMFCRSMHMASAVDQPVSESKHCRGSLLIHQGMSGLKSVCFGFQSCPFVCNKFALHSRETVWTSFDVAKAGYFLQDFPFKVKSHESYSLVCLMLHPLFGLTADHLITFISTLFPPSFFLPVFIFWLGLVKLHLLLQETNPRKMC